MLKNSSGILISYTLSMMFFFFSVSAVQFHSILFESKGFVGIRFGLLLMTGALSGIFAPIVMASVIKRFKKSTHALLVLMTFAGLSLPIMPQLHSFWSMIIVFFFHTFCVWCLFPLHMSCGLDACREKGDYFFFILRALGTLGFLLGCIFALVFVDVKGVSWLYPIFSASYIGALISVLILIFLSKNKNLFSITSTENLYSFKVFTSLKIFFSNPTFLRLMIVIAILCCANSMAIGVQGNYILHHFQGQKSHVSLSWMLCTGFEIPIMIFCLYLLRNFGLHRVLQISIGATCLRLVFLSMAQSPLFFSMGLLLHGFYWAGVVTGVGICIDRIYGEHRTLFQIFAALIYSGAPSSTGNFFTGLIWRAHSLEAVYAVSTGLGIIAFLLFIPVLPKLKALTSSKEPLH